MAVLAMGIWQRRPVQATGIAARNAMPVTQCAAWRDVLLMTIDLLAGIFGDKS